MTSKVLKYFVSLRGLILLALSLMAVLQVVYIFSYLYENERKNIEWHIQQDLRNMGLSLQGSIEFLMRQGHEEQVKVQLSELGANPEIRHALLADQNQLIFASTKLANIDNDLWQVLNGFAQNDREDFERNINNAIHQAHGNVWTTADRAVVVAVYPVAAFAEDEGIRLPKTGTLLIVRDLENAVNESYGLVFLLIIFQVLSLAMLGALLHFLVLQRIKTIEKGTALIAQGNYDVVIPLAGNDELALLARGIENVAMQVEKSHWEQEEQQAHIQDLLDAVTRSEETFAKAQEIAHIGSWDWDIEGGSLSWSDEIYRIFGLEPQEFGATYEAFLKSVHPDDQEIVINAVNSAVADESVPYIAEHRVVHPDGTVRNVNEQGKVYRDEQGTPVRMIGTVMDITERKKTEKALSEERNFINAILNSAGALVVVLDKLGRIVRFNYACERVSGYKFEEVKNKTPWNTVLPKENAVEIYEEAFKQLIEHPEDNVGYYTNGWVSKDGQSSLIEWTNTLLLDKDGQVEFMVSTGIDVTEKNKAEVELEKYRDNLEQLVEKRTEELKAAQDELIRSERLATLGQLTATVSHELRNPLGAMAPSLYVVKKIADPENERMQQAIERIGRNIERCDRIIDELLDFTRIEKVSLVTTALDAWLITALDEQNVPPGIVVNRELSLGNEEAIIDVDVLRRAVINVYENACHAMQDESNGNKAIEGAVLTISSVRDGDKLKIIFRDTGSGMSDETLKKIFEPLYSTKGFGVGLGMPTVKQIMNQHDGGIEVESEMSVGTTVVLWLPVIK